MAAWADDFDLDAELVLWCSGLGKVKFEFSGKTDVAYLNKLVAHHVLGWLRKIGRDNDAMRAMLEALCAKASASGFSSKARSVTAPGIRPTGNPT